MSIDPGTNKLPIIIGSAVGGLALVGLAIYCFIRKRNQNLAK